MWRSIRSEVPDIAWQPPDRLEPRQFGGDETGASIEDEAATALGRSRLPL